jgi:Lon-like ATP-dependent protease
VLPAGVVMGLAWTSMGGSTLVIECINTHATYLSLSPSLDVVPDAGSRAGKDREGGKFEMSGSLGDVMKESGRIALSFARVYLRKIAPENSFFDTVPLHCPLSLAPPV